MFETFTFPNSYFTYTGEWKQTGNSKVPHGKGFLMLGDGSSYEGEFVDGEIEGEGVKRWADGSIYTGQFHYGEMNGYGVITKANGEKYEGEMQNNKRHGKGKLITPTGEEYEGEFQDHKLHGSVKAIYKQKDMTIIFTGTFQEGKTIGNGRAIYIFPETGLRDIYEGRTACGGTVRHGEGKLISSFADQKVGAIAVTGTFTANKRDELPSDIRAEAILDSELPVSAAPIPDQSEILQLKPKEMFGIKAYLGKQVVSQKQSKSKIVTSTEILKITSEFGRPLVLTMYKVNEKVAESITKTFKQKSYEEVVKGLPTEALTKIEFGCITNVDSSFDEEEKLQEVAHAKIEDNSFEAYFRSISIPETVEGLIVCKLEDYLTVAQVKSRTFIPTAAIDAFYYFVQVRQEKPTKKL